MNKMHLEYEYISKIDTTLLEGNTTTGLLAACGLDRDESYSVGVAHKKVLEQHHNKLGYVMLYKREKSKSVNVWCYPKGFDHNIVFDTAANFKAEGKQVVIYEVLGSNTIPKLGALNVFCSWDERYNMERLLDTKCEFKVI